ncbi:hypothetical protein EVJ32_04850 [Exiguobacterium sp. SH5S4]|uniref:hypothetical protein n=1 Tax=Exiguobacterium sp. SH5S4 TaxID=2510961 RepID=UPI00103E82D1|nr:hypothetical protein [Exiguobacterium sp. SH5S4]TCI26705.1 hypothetical protein EVJ32_04850 [Exiguobacterium sp. SH5S4]
MIDLRKHEKVSGIKGIHALLDGNPIYDRHGNRFEFDKEHGTVWFYNQYTAHEDTTSLSLLLLEDWYLKKPFNAQQAMIDNPDTWVAAYETDECKHWYKVGFELETMSVVTLPYEKDEKVTSNHVGYLDDIELEDILKKCINIEDVPESAKNHADLFKKKKYVSPALLCWFKDTYKHLSDEDLDKVLSGIVEYKDDSIPVEFVCGAVMIPYTGLSMPQVRYKIHEETAKLYGIREEFPHFADDRGVLVIKYKTPQDVL